MQEHMETAVLQKPVLRKSLCADVPEAKTSTDLHQSGQPAHESFPQTQTLHELAFMQIAGTAVGKRCHDHHHSACTVFHRRCTFLHSTTVST